MSGHPLSRDARLVLVGTGLNAIGNGFVLPFLVIYLHEVRHLSLAVTGAIVASQALVGMVVVPVYGILIDRLGARAVQLGTLVLSTLGAVGFAVATDAGVALAAATVYGLGTAGYWPAAQSFVAELVPPEVRSRYFGLSFVLVNLGIGVGGLSGAAIVRPGHLLTYQLLFLADAVTFLAFFVVLLSVRLPRAVTVDETTEAGGTSYLSLLKDPVFRRVIAMQLVLVVFGYGQLDTAFPAYARQVGASVRVVGISFAINTFVIVVLQMWVQRRLTSVRRSRALVAVSLSWAGAWLLLAAAQGLPRGAAVTAVVLSFPAAFAIGEMLLSPTMPALVNDLAEDRVRGRYNAAWSWCWAVGEVVGPATGGALLGAGAAGVWLGLTVGGCALGAVLALRLERVVPRAANVGPAEAPEITVDGVAGLSVGAAALP